MRVLFLLFLLFSSGWTAASGCNDSLQANASAGLGPGLFVSSVPDFGGCGDDEVPPEMREKVFQSFNESGGEFVQQLDSLAQTLNSSLNNPREPRGRGNPVMAVFLALLIAGSLVLVAYLYRSGRVK